MKLFRVHHILCTDLYTGKGYDDAFCRNMTAFVTALKTNPKQKVCLVTAADALCENCPYLSSEGFCQNGNNHVHKKDKQLLDIFHLTENREYTYQQLLQAAGMYLTEEKFKESCQSCTWYQQGICRYKDFSFFKSDTECD